MPPFITCRPRIATKAVASPRRALYVACQTLCLAHGKLPAAHSAIRGILHGASACRAFGLRSHCCQRPRRSLQRTPGIQDRYNVHLAYNTDATYTCSVWPSVQNLRLKVSLTPPQTAQSLVRHQHPSLPTQYTRARPSPSNAHSVVVPATD